MAAHNQKSGSCSYHDRKGQGVALKDNSKQNLPNGQSCTCEPARLLCVAEAAPGLERVQVHGRCQEAWLAGLGPRRRKVGRSEIRGCGVEACAAFGSGHRA